MHERQETTVATPAWVSALCWVGFPLLGAGVGWLLPRLVGWVASADWVPLPGPLRLLASAPEPQTTIVTIVLGVAAGLTLAVMAAQEQLTVTVSGHRVTLTRADATTELAGSQVRGAFLDGKQLVLLGQAGEELARETTDLAAEELEHAFTGHSYRWYPGDPYRDDFRRWVPETPDLPVGADALLKAREQALARDDHDDAAELRNELAKLGVVVREEKKTRQYWRLVQ